MLKFLIEQAHKGIKQVTVAAETKTGTPVDTYFVYDKEMEYTGLNAVVDPRMKDNDTIANGSLANRVPIAIGDRLATDQVTVGSMVSGATCEPASGKWAANATAHYKYYGVWAENPYGTTMYIIERVS